MNSQSEYLKTFIRLGFFSHGYSFLLFIAGANHAKWMDQQKNFILGWNMISGIHFLLDGHFAYGKIETRPGDRRNFVEKNFILHLEYSRSLNLKLKWSSLLLKSYFVCLSKFIILFCFEYEIYPYLPTWN